MGAYGRDAQDGYVAPAAIAAAKTWAIATPVSLALRGLLKGYVPPTPFIVVSFVVTGTLLIGWRSALAAFSTPEVRRTVAVLPCDVRCRVPCIPADVQITVTISHTFISVTYAAVAGQANCSAALS